MTPLKKIWCLFETRWLNGGNDCPLGIYDPMRFITMAGFATV